MPHFAITKYDPAEDSTAGQEEYAKQTGCVVLNAVRREDDHELIGCPCGCEGVPVGRKATFLMGHDARLRGKLIRAHLTDTKVIQCTDGVRGSSRTAMSVASDYGDSFVDALKGADLRREGKNREVVQKALHSKRLVKVGRWQYTGQVAAIYSTPGGDEYEIEYVTKQGETRKVRVPASQTEEVSD